MCNRTCSDAESSTFTVLVMGKLACCVIPGLDCADACRVGKSGICYAGKRVFAVVGKGLCGSGDDSSCMGLGWDLYMCFYLCGKLLLSNGRGSWGYVSCFCQATVGLR